MAWRVLRPFVIAYVCAVVITMLIESWLVYPAPSIDAGDWQPAGLDYEDVWFTSADGTKLNGWFFPHPTSKRAILYCHGNGEHVALDAPLATALRDVLNASVFVFDYRGYGHSEGRPNEAGCIADAQAARDWLTDRLHIDTDDVVLMGRSLGGGVAVALAADGGARALILENTFSTMVDVAARTHWWLPVRLLMRNRYDSVSRIQQYDGPLFQSHGADDTLVPIAMGRRLFDAAPSQNKQFTQLPGFGHNDWPRRDYYRNLAVFLDEIDASH